MNRLKQLAQEGQAVWLDYIRRDLLEGGELRRLIADGGISGVTSNPAIFNKAIAESDLYDEQLRSLVQDRPAENAAGLYEKIALRDIQSAADLLHPVWDQTKGGDGYVSLEVSPNLAEDTEGTIAEARRLWRRVDRPNLMIKVPATAAGIPAIEELLSEGIPVNITLMFSIDHYEQVAEAYLRSLERGADPQTIASVASFFVSRVDSWIDPLLEEKGGEALSLTGQVAIANCKVVYRRFQEIFGGKRFTPFADQGARPQRLLWASTSAKNPLYRDVVYVEQLIGADTVNTMPPETMEAFQDHGDVSCTLTEGIDTAEGVLADLDRLGIDLAHVTQELQAEGVKKFVQPFNSLLATLNRRRTELLREVGAPSA